MNIESLNADMVRSVYSGRDGKCCCGCSGTHSYNPKFVAEASADRGYPVGPEELNLGMVTKVIRLIKENAADATVEDNLVWIVRGNRLYIAYLLEGAA